MGLCHASKKHINLPERLIPKHLIEESLCLSSDESSCEQNASLLGLNFFERLGHENDATTKSKAVNSLKSTIGSSSSPIPSLNFKKQTTLVFNQKLINSKNELSFGSRPNLIMLL